jgi:D-proline reductase (dithiol) PrdB
MARLPDFNETTRNRLLNLECSAFEIHPWVTGPPLARRRVAIIS